MSCPWFICSRFWNWEVVLESSSCGTLSLTSLLPAHLFRHCSLSALPHAPSFLLVLSHFLSSSLSTHWCFIKAYSPLMVSYGVVVWNATWVFLTSFRKSSTLSSSKVSTWLRWNEYCWFCISIPRLWSVTLESCFCGFQESSFIKEWLPMTLAHSLSNKQTPIPPKRGNCKKKEEECAMSLAVVFR